MEREFYKVLAKCGHVGKNWYIKKWFFVTAISGKDAASFVRTIGRVKHNQKDAILNVLKIDYREYIEGLNNHKTDLYFNVNNSTEQRLLNCINPLDVFPENNSIMNKKDKRGKPKKRMLFEIIEKETKRYIQGGIYE